MASTPTTLVLFSADRTILPIKAVYAVARHLFQFGVKDISQKTDKVIVNLNYSPRAATLKKKFGNLPLRYMRTKIESEEEFKILEQVVKRFKFNLLDEELETSGASSSSSSSTSQLQHSERLRILPSVDRGVKRKLMIDEIFSSDDDDDDNDDDREVEKATLKELQSEEPQPKS